MAALPCASRWTPHAHNAASTRATSTRSPTTSMTAWSVHCPPPQRDEHCRLASSPTRRTPSPSCCVAAVDVVTDQTSAHDPLHGYVPSGMTLDEAAELRRTKPQEYVQRARESMARHCEAMVGFQQQGAEVFDYGNNLRGEARLGGFDDAFAYPGFVPAYIRPLFCEAKGPFRWVALSGDPADIAATDAAVAEAFADDEPLQRWLALARERVAFQGLPARICWLGYGERAEAGARFDDLVASGKVRAPIVIGRDHLDSG